MAWQQCPSPLRLVYTSHTKFTSESHSQIHEASSYVVWHRLTVTFLHAACRTGHSMRTHHREFRTGRGELIELWRHFSRPAIFRPREQTTLKGAEDPRLQRRRALRGKRSKKGGYGSGLLLFLSTDHPRFWQNLLIMLTLQMGWVRGEGGVIIWRVWDWCPREDCSYSAVRQSLWWWLIIDDVPIQNPCRKKPHTKRNRRLSPAAR